MAGVSYGNRGGRVRGQKIPDKARPTKSAEDVVREMKASMAGRDEEYRERSLALHGLICARCGREFDTANRHMLTVHHKDGNHHNNPPDGSNWENLCAYCHEDVHSRELLGDYLQGMDHGREKVVVYQDEASSKGMVSLAEKLQKAIEKKNRK
jgi:5-methylcytosine-specific restriction endonuclease McrA